MKLEVTGGTILLDNNDYQKVSGYTWRVDSGGRAITTFKKLDNRRSSMLMQKAILGDPPKGMRVHFKNGNLADCRRENMEFRTVSEIRKLSEFYTSGKIFEVARKNAALKVRCEHGAFVEGKQCGTQSRVVQCKSTSTTYPSSNSILGG